MPETSIVIRSFNEAEHIGAVLEAVDQQEYQDFEIILVDSGSTDGTLDIAKEYVDSIEFVAPENFTFGYSCNIGCEAASGRFVSFLSAHAIPSGNQWLGTMVENLRDDQVAMTYSNQIGVETTKFSERRLFDELFPDDRKRQTPPNYWANNASSVIKKDLWEDHQFDEYLTGHEDIEWAKHFMDKGYVVIYEPESCIYHIHNETWEQVFNRFEREAIADVEIGVKDPSDRWDEYLAIPRDILGDLFAAVKSNQIDPKTVAEICLFRYNQHKGTASGLVSERDLESDRYEYFYGGANEKVVLNSDGSAAIERGPLPAVKPNEILIRTDYIGVTADETALNSTGHEMYPIVPSGNYVGTVADIGANATAVEVGDTVVGETKFGCGLCSACSGGNEHACEDPIELGIDTEDGAYSRFLVVPSDHAYRLPDDVNPRDGTLVRTLAQVARDIDRATTLLLDDATCLVLGDSPRARIAKHVLDQNSNHVDHISPSSRPDGTASSTSYDLVLDVTGDATLVEKYIQESGPRTVVLLLGTGYGKVTLSDDAPSDTTVMKSGETSFEDMNRGLELLSGIDTTTIFDGTYAFEEYESAWRSAAEGQGFPVIEIDP